MPILKLLLFVFVTIVHVNSIQESFKEELFLKLLNNAHIYSYFQFTTQWNNNLDYRSFKHCKSFSLSLGEIIGRYNIEELHVSLTEGFWHYKRWGYPVVDAAPGAEVWVWFKDDTKNVDQAWKDLVNALSGLLCASLNFINEVSSTSPQLSFRPKGFKNSNKPLNSTFVRYSCLPREIVCTENLTPWKKLLPCDASGLVTLLNARYIHNTNYHSLGIHFRPACSNDNCGVELRLTVSLVFDLMIILGNHKDWSIRKLFGNAIIGICPVSQSTNVYLDITPNETVPFTITKQPNEIRTYKHENYESRYAVYNVSDSAGTKFSFEVFYKDGLLPFNTVPSIVQAHRYIAGYGHESGKIVTKIYNNFHKPVKIVYFENIPWFLPIYYQSLKITHGTRNIVPLKTYYKPGKSRTRPYYLEVLFELPEHSIAHISIDFEYVFLKWQEYPPDANHGFYVGSAIITAVLPIHKNYTFIPLTVNKNVLFNVTNEEVLVEIRTENLIIALPTPDFSMPYNVICLACTVVALAFGPIHNITTKKLCFSKKTKKRGFRKIFAYAKYCFQKIFAKRT